MKEYNFEEQLERKLKERAIAPSPDAWERVAYNRLQQKKRKKNLLWYLIPVAAILCIGMFITLFSNNEVIIPNKETIVNRQTKQITEPVNYETEIRSVANEIPTEIGTIAKTPIEAQNQSFPQAPPPPTEIVSNVTANDLIKDFEIQKANEVAISITKLNESGPVTDDVIDSLLLKAQREIALERLKTSNKTIDEAALLKEAETEVEKSFRDKVYHLFTHKTIKVAIKQ